MEVLTPADVVDRGFFAAMNAFKDMKKEHIKESTVVLIGCGPVGLCALINAEEYKPKHLLAVDSIQSRLDLAKSLGAEPWNFQTDREGLDTRVKELTDGRGADVVIGRRISINTSNQCYVDKPCFDRGCGAESCAEDGFRSAQTMGCHI